MKILDNSFTQPDSKMLADNDQVKIEQTKLSEDLSTTTITVHAMQEYTFTARSSIVQVFLGAGVISSGSQQHKLDLFNKIAIERNERITLYNNQNIPLIVNIISAN